MKSSELRDLTDDKLLDHLEHARRELFGLRLQHATGELENTTALRTAKREIARALTMAKQRGLDTSTRTTARTAA